MNDPLVSAWAELLEPESRDLRLEDIQFELDHPDSGQLAVVLNDLDRMANAFLEHYAKEESAKSAMWSAMGLLDETEWLRAGSNSSPDDLRRVWLTFCADCARLPVDERLTVSHAHRSAKGTKSMVIARRKAADVRIKAEMKRAAREYAKLRANDPLGFWHPKLKDLEAGSNVKLHRLQKLGLGKIQSCARKYANRPAQTPGEKMTKA